MDKRNIWLVLFLAAAVLCPLAAYAAMNGGAAGQGPGQAGRDGAAGIWAGSTTGNPLPYTSPYPGSSAAPGPSVPPASAGSAAAGAPAAAQSQAPPMLPCKYYAERDFMVSVAAVENRGAGKSSGVGSPVGSGSIKGPGGPDKSAGSGSTGRTTGSGESGISGEPGGTGGSVRADGSGDSGISSASEDSGRIIGGIVPHHLLAGKMIASFFKTLSESNPQTLVLLAPNHRRIGHSGINTSLLDWNTPFGALKNGTALTNRLITVLKASQNNMLMEEEHSISSLVPYIKYYMPDVEIVPVLLHGNYTAEEASRLGRLLSAELSADRGMAVVASVDFSHYLDAEKADRMDEKTLAAILSFDLGSISLMGNDNLDSPPSILALLTAMQETGTSAPEVTGHDNSSNITGKGADYTTSYFTMLFRHPGRNP